MGKLTRAANHLTLEQVREKMKESKDTRQLVRWQIVYTALLELRKAEDIAMCIVVSTSHVKKIISCYYRDGIQSIEIRKCGGRYYEYLTKEEEMEFLTPFFKRASYTASNYSSSYLCFCSCCSSIWKNGLTYFANSQY